jgi:methyl-accepting chemotaxis protein
MRIPDLERLDRIAATLRSGSNGPSRSANYLKQFESTLKKSDEYHHRVLIGSLLAGITPPAPRTLRASIGAVLVRVVQRSIFWFTQQVQEFQKATAERIQEHAQLLRAQRLETAQLRERVEEMEKTVKQLSETLAQLANCEENK